MADKCKNCDGSGVVVDVREATGTMLVVAWACLDCDRFSNGKVVVDRVRLCCKVHDELVAALKLALKPTGGWIPPEVESVMHAAIAKAQPVKESTTA